MSIIYVQPLLKVLLRDSGVRVIQNLPALTVVLEALPDRVRQLPTRIDVSE